MFNPAPAGPGPAAGPDADTDKSEEDESEEDESEDEKEDAEEDGEDDNTECASDYAETDSTATLHGQSTDKDPATDSTDKDPDTDSTGTTNGSGYCSHDSSIVSDAGTDVDTD